MGFGWISTVTDFDKSIPGKRDIQYTIEEEAVEGYAATINGYDIINTHTPKPEIEKTSVTVVKKWNDADNKDGIRPESINVHLFADRIEIDSHEIRADKNGEWTYTFEDLDVGTPGARPIMYTITEDEVEGYTATINGYEITNKHTPGPDEPEMISIAGGVIWDDANDKDGIRPKEVTVTLIADGSRVERSQTVSADERGRWICTFTDV